MLRTLFDCHMHKKVVSIFCNQARPETHITGFVSALSDELLIMQHITPNGRYDGYIMIRVSDIYRLDIGGKYEQKIQTLYTEKKQSHTSFTINGDLYNSFLNFGKENDFVISVELEDVELSGVILSFDNQQIHLLAFNEYGELEGETILLADSINSFSIDTTKEQDIKMLRG